MQAVQKPTTGQVVFFDFAKARIRRDNARALMVAMAPRKLQRAIRATQRRDAVRQAARAAL